MNPSKPWNELQVFHSTTQDCGLVCNTSLIAGIMAELYSGSDLAVSLLGRKLMLLQDTLIKFHWCYLWQLP